MTHFINNQWIQGSGSSFFSFNPASQEPVYETRAATPKEVDLAVSAALKALEIWVNFSVEERFRKLEMFTTHLKQNALILAETISKETGKPLWDAQHEIEAMLAKIPLSLEAYLKRCPQVERPQHTGISITRHKPHGVVAVLGPFNFPGHLPNGHIVPALLAGNTVVFKPSEYTPLTATLMLHCWEKAQLPAGVLNLVQGKGETGKALVEHPWIAGVFFTGSVRTGSLILKTLGAQPDKILALEMGGNNPLIISSYADSQAAASLTIQSAYLTSGQRCTCARRLILIENRESENFLQTLLAMMHKIRVGRYQDTPEPYMGPVISQQAVKEILNAQHQLKLQGGIPLMETRLLKENTALLSPGLMDVTNIHERVDQEIFGPFLQLIRVKSLEDAIVEANQTRYGLSAGLVSNSKEEYTIFYRHMRAGIVNWNHPLTGASSAAPFGGIGLSGNHRPSAFYAADYCSYPVASLESDKISIPSLI